MTTENRPHQLDSDKIASATKGVLNDGGAVPGCALEIHVRNGGKSKRAYFRYPGTRFGEKRTERVPIGSYTIGLVQLRRERVTCEQLIEQDTSPKRYYRDQKERQHSARRTLRVAVQEFFVWAGGGGENEPALWKSPQTRRTNECIKAR